MPANPPTADVKSSNGIAETTSMTNQPFDDDDDDGEESRRAAEPPSRPPHYADVGRLFVLKVLPPFVAKTYGEPLCGRHHPVTPPSSTSNERTPSLQTDSDMP